MAAIGGILALGLNAATGDTERGAAVTLLAAGACYVIAGLVAATMGRDLLGPDSHPDRPAARLGGELATVAADLAEGARYVLRRRGPASALAATGGGSLLFGILILMSVLLYRNYFYAHSAPAAEAHYTVLVTLAAVGYGCAALVIPPVTRRLTKPATITVLFAAGAVVIGILGETFAQGAFLAIGFCLYLIRQGVAICSTTILQEGVGDAYRGRVFSFYDMMFNVTYVLGAAVVAGFMPVTGRSPVIIAIVAAGYAVTAAGYWLLSHQSVPDPGEPGPASPSPSAQRSSS
jgi:hypothetical protein